MKCVYCGSPRLARNPEGFTVCIDCGSVVSEDIIDDYANIRVNEESLHQKRDTGKPLKRESPIHPLTLKAIYRRVLRLGRVYDYEKGRLVSLLDLRAEASVARRGEIARILKILEGEGVARGKSPRVSVGLAFYVLCRAEGRGKEKCIEEASAASGASKSRLRALASEYSLLLDEIAFRVKVGWRGEQG